MDMFKEKDDHQPEFEKKLVDGREEELNELKAWLFRENIRVETEKKDLKHRQEEFLKEKQQFQREMDEVNRRLVVERKRLKQDELFFDKKMDILKSGFLQLDAERKQLNREKQEFAGEKRGEEKVRRMEYSQMTAKLLFQGVKSQLALKKRYRDLLKMFHPDNIAGDHEMVLLINAAYEELKEEYDIGKRA